MPIPFFDLTRQYKIIGPSIEQAAKDVLSSGQYILGERVASFERNVADYLNVKHAIGVASGTDALHLSLRALGVGPGDEVITTPFSFFATAEMISTCDARPVFVDIEEDSFNIDPRKIASAITANTRAILPVHLFGLCSSMDAILDIARSHNLKVIEDSAQAIGARHKGAFAGAIGDTGCFSFFPTKNLGCCGDGGLVTTNDDSIAERIRSLRVHGSRQRYIHSELGFSSRLDALQAAILDVKLRHLDEWHNRRREIAQRYRKALSGETPDPPPDPPSDFHHVYHQFTIRVSNRSRVMDVLRGTGVGSMIYYPVPLHLQEAYKSSGFKKGDFPVAERACEEVLSLPIFPELTDSEVDTICEAILSADN